MINLIISITTLSLTVSKSNSFVTKNIKSGQRIENRLIFSAKEGPADSNDLVTKLFGRFLPTPTDVGLKRYTRETRPENYPCIKDVWAENLPTDKDDMLIVRQTLANTNLENRELKITYSANRDGWKATIFHQKVDKLGPAVVLARTASGGLFGGYNPTGWVNYGEYRGSIAAFLYMFPNGDAKSRPIKLAKIGGAGLAQMDDGGGPKFGSEGLTIALAPDRPKLVRSKLGLYYENLPNGKRSVLPNAAAFDELTDLIVFTGVYAPGEKIPYSDAIPFALN
eukprot:gene9733-20246_t